MVKALEDYRITEMSLNDCSVFALTETGTVFACGSGSFGRLGFGTNDSAMEFTHVALLDRHRVVSLSAGYYHSGVVTDTGRLLTFGDGDTFKLGLSPPTLSTNPPAQMVPTVVSALSAEHVTCCAMGKEYSLVVTSDGALYGLGSNSYGVLGLPETSMVKAVRLAWLKHLFCVFRYCRGLVGEWRG